MPVIVGKVIPKGNVIFYNLQLKYKTPAKRKCNIWEINYSGNQISSFFK
jgi:hypothetical protein